MVQHRVLEVFSELLPRLDQVHLPADSQVSVRWVASEVLPLASVALSLAPLNQHLLEASHSVALQSSKELEASPLVEQQLSEVRQAKVMTHTTSLLT